MGRFAPAETVTGTVKSIQHITASLENATQNVSITAVSDVNKAVSYQCWRKHKVGGGAGTDVKARSGHHTTTAQGRLTSTTNVALILIIWIFGLVIHLHINWNLSRISY